MKKTILILALTITLFSCNKDNQEELKDVVYTCYSENSNAILYYIDKDENWHEVQINQQNYTLTIKQVEENYWYQTHLKSQGADSLHITASSEGRTVEEGHRNTTVGETNVSIQLTQLR